MLIYLSHTRPDIAFAIRIVSQYMHALYKEHMESMYRILKYLKGSIGKGLFFRKNETRTIEGFTDANWASTIEDQRSTSGYCTLGQVQYISPFHIRTHKPKSKLGSET